MGISPFCINYSVHSSWNALYKAMKNLMIHFRSNLSNVIWSHASAIHEENLTFCIQQLTGSVSQFCLHLKRDLEIVKNLQYDIFKILNISFLCFKDFKILKSSVYFRFQYGWPSTRINDSTMNATNKLRSVPQVTHKGTVFRPPSEVDHVQFVSGSICGPLDLCIVNTPSFGHQLLEPKSWDNYRWR